STDGGANYPYVIEIGTHPAGNNSYAWLVPSYDTTTARVRICVDATDGSNACTASAADFAIDSTSPYIVSTWPSDGATGFGLNWTITIEFSEVMDKPTVTWTIVPFLVLEYSWSNYSPILYLSPSPTGPGFEPCMQYTIGIDGRDLAGNPLSGG